MRMRINKGVNMVRVSGVPYEVDLPSNDDIIATLEHENRCMRARMDRLEDELKVANDLLAKMNIELLNFYNASKTD
jgi:hypothetical protein